MKIDDLFKHNIQVIEARDDDKEDDDQDFDSLLDKYMDSEKLHRIEGRAGVTNLATICRALGYKDPNHYGQLSKNASIGDLINFLEDNSGAIEAIIEFIREEGDRNPEWQENLRDFSE